MTSQTSEPIAAKPQPAWRGIFRDLAVEHGFVPLRVEGHVPEDLHGTLYRNGPSRFAIGDWPYPHWFDGDGAITAVCFDGDRPQGAVRLIDTHWFRKEQAAGRPLYRGYGRPGHGWRRFFALPKSPANISVLPWEGRLFALWEAGLPIELDPDSLATLGPKSLGGAVGPTFSAHPHRAGDTVFNFGVAYGLRFTLELYALGREARRLGSVPLARPTSLHDFIATPRNLIFFLPPIRHTFLRFLAGIGSFQENLFWEPEHGTEIVVVPLATPDKPIRFTVPPFFLWHFVNAWEEADGTVVVDYIPYDDFKTNAWFGRAPFDEPSPPPPSRYARARLDPAARRLTVETLSEASCEFPAIDPSRAGLRHDVTWFLSFGKPPESPPPTLSRFDPATRTRRQVPLGKSEFPSEAVVVPRAKDREGWILSVVYSP